MSRKKKETQVPYPTHPPELSTGKRSVFTLVMLLVPFTLLAILELSLRQFEYDGNLNLVVTRTVGGQQLYSINRSVARRYFAHMSSVIPEPADDTFSMVKASNAKRIFCLGESTMAGFPYELNATAPSFMRDRLKLLLPQYNIEVINAGLSAVGSFVVQDFMDELLSYQPDLFIIYVGHNEFYGIYGEGSSINIPGGPWLTRLTISLLKFKTFLMLRDVYAWLRSQFAKAAHGDETLMGQMVGNQTIPLHSKLYETSKRIYHDNLIRMIQTARSHNIPIMFSSLVSNWRGQKPFVGAFDESTLPDQRVRWERTIEKGDSLASHNDLREAAHRYANAVQIDSMNAIAFFDLGNALYNLGQYDDARKAFLRAKDLDALRFRASEEFETELINTCAQFRVPLARVDSTFIAQSPHGVPGNELFLEHLHPNVNGYFLTAKTFTRAIEENHLLAPPSEWNLSSEPSDSALMQLSCVTEFDRTLGAMKIDLLERRWPFTLGPVNYEFSPSNYLEGVVIRVIRHKLAWSEARYLLAEDHARNKRYDLAREECRAVSKVIPFSYEPLLRVADYYNVEGKRGEAKNAYRQCFETEDNPFARMKYAILLLEDEEPAAAAAQIDTAFDLDSHGRYKLPVPGLATGRYLLGVAYAKLGKIGKAKENLQRAIAIQPGYADAKELLDQLERR